MHSRGRFELRRRIAMTTLNECRACRRLVRHLARIEQHHPDWHNAPVPALGPNDAPLLVLGLAPGRKGATRTGKPFVGDRSADWLLKRLRARACVDENGHPVGIRISNAVKCLPPQNRPSITEIRRCGQRWLGDEIRQTRAVLALGKIAHDAVLRVLNVRLSTYPFSHGAEHRVGTVNLVDSFHPSPLNTATGRLSPEQFDAALCRALELSENTR